MDREFDDFLNYIERMKFKKSDKKNRSKYLRLTVETNALDYLEKADFYIKQTERNVIAWKWVILSLHGSLYGFAICACKGTDPDNVTYEKKNGEKWLIDFNKALKRCQDPNYMQMTVMSKHLQLSESQEKSINILKNVLRNKLEHYIPISWSIEIHGMPQITIDVLDVIRFLALDTGNYVMLNFSQIKKIKSIIYQSKQILKKSYLYKENYK